MPRKFYTPAEKTVILRRLHNRVNKSDIEDLQEQLLDTSGFSCSVVGDKRPAALSLNLKLAYINFHSEQAATTAQRRLNGVASYLCDDNFDKLEAYTKADGEPEDSEMEEVRTRAFFPKFMRSNIVAAAAKEGRQAIIICIDDYDESSSFCKLCNSVTDGENLGNLLKSMEWNVDLVKNATLDEISQAVNRFKSNVVSKYACLFAFVGHGCEANGDMFLIPKDAKLPNHSNATEQQALMELNKTSLPFKQVLMSLIDIRNVEDCAQTVFVLDCCRTSVNSKYGEASRGIQIGIDCPRDRLITPKTNIENSLIIYSACSGQEAKDGKRGAGGPFMNMFVEKCKQHKDKSVSDVLMMLRRKFKGDQLPDESSKLCEPFFLAPEAEVSELKQQPQQAAQTLRLETAEPLCSDGPTSPSTPSSQGTSCDDLIVETEMTADEQEQIQRLTREQSAIQIHSFSVSLHGAEAYLATSSCQAQYKRVTSLMGRTVWTPASMTIDQKTLLLLKKPDNRTPKSFGPLRLTEVTAAASDYSGAGLGIEFSTEMGQKYLHFSTQELRDQVLARILAVQKAAYEGVKVNMVRFEDNTNCVAFVGPNTALYTGMTYAGTPCRWVYQGDRAPHGIIRSKKCIGQELAYFEVAIRSLGKTCPFSTIAIGLSIQGDGFGSFTSSGLTMKMGEVCSSAVVVRGPNWKWGDQDCGGFGRCMIKKDSAQSVFVHWHNSKQGEETKWYRWGLDDCYDIAGAVTGDIFNRVDLVCSKGHTASMANVTLESLSGQYMCDNCKSTLRRATKFRRCAECDYDICYKCSVKVQEESLSTLCTTTMFCPSRDVLTLASRLGCGVLFKESKPSAVYYTVDGKLVACTAAPKNFVVCPTVVMNAKDACVDIDLQAVAPQLSKFKVRNTEYSTLNEAIDACTSADKIQMTRGIHLLSEFVNVSKDINLIGAPTIQQAADYVIMISGNQPCIIGSNSKNITVSGISFRSCGGIGSTSYKEGGNLTSCLFARSCKLTVSKCILASQKGYGMIADNDSFVEVSNCKINQGDDARLGILTHGKSSVTVNDCYISSGSGSISVHDESMADMKGCTLEKGSSLSPCIAAYCKCKGKLTMTNCVLNDFSTGVSCVGTDAGDASKTIIKDCTFQRLSTACARAEGGGAVLEVIDVKIASSKGGVQSARGAATIVKNLSSSTMSEYSVLCIGAKSTIKIDDSRLNGGQLGISVISDSSVEARRLQISNCTSGVQVSDKATIDFADSSLISCGTGLSARSGAKPKVTRVEFTGMNECGVLCSGEETACKLVDCQVKTAPVAFRATNHGVIFYEKCIITASKDKVEETQGKVASV